LLAALVAAAVAGIVIGGIALVRHDYLPRLLARMAEIIGDSRERLPLWLVESIPADPDAIRDATSAWLREHAVELRRLGGEAGHAVVHIFIGIVIGALVSMREAKPIAPAGPLAAALGERARRVGDAFRRVVFAQARIAAINAFLTAIYLVVALPLFDVHLPFAKSLVAITFVAGLIPVVGNLISNAIILIMSLSVSPGVALASLAFLVVIHKLEYFLNARIVGQGIHAAAWELLVAMLVMEAAFGIEGLVAAPIYYAYLKDELAARRLL
jgi:predicted PurR-regulated permease PerM